MLHNADMKIEYFEKTLIPLLKLAFERGDSKYIGVAHSHSPHHIVRTPKEDINHIRELHVDVRLKEAEEAADNGKLALALEKIESALGYLGILHMRTMDKVKGN